MDNTSGQSHVQSNLSGKFDVQDPHSVLVVISNDLLSASIGSGHQTSHLNISI